MDNTKFKLDAYTTAEIEFDGTVYKMSFIDSDDNTNLVVRMRGHEMKFFVKKITKFLEFTSEELEEE